MMKNLILLFALSFLTFCKSPPKPDKEQLLKVDREFSATAVEKGFNRAFIEFAHPEAVLLRDNCMPLKGTYISVWKKDAAGNWKYVLDSGNKGIG